MAQRVRTSITSSQVFCQQIKTQISTIFKRINGLQRVALSRQPSAAYDDMVLYWNELQHKKAPHTHLQKFSDRHEGRLQHALLPYCKEYCNNSSIHCMHYLSDAKMQKSEKAIWFLILLATTICATYVYFELTELYFTQRIQTTIANSVLPIFYVPFPSIGICVRNSVDLPKLQTAHRHFLPANASLQRIEIFQRFFEQLQHLKFDELIELAPLFNNKTIVEQLHLIDDVNILDVLTYLTLNCSDVFESCHWRKIPYNCCDIFSLERTEVGFCQVFNSVINQKQQNKAESNKYYPYHNSKSGESSGLEVILKLNDSRKDRNLTQKNGVYVMVKQPQQWHDTPRFISPNTYTKISITPQQTETDHRIRSVTPNERQCIFEDEHNHPLYKKIPGLLYWRGNCRTRCHQEYLVKYCNCTVSLLFPKHSNGDNFTECKPSDFRCIYQHEDFFSSEHLEAESNYIDNIDNDGMVCNCLNSCNQLLYMPYFISAPLQGSHASDPIKKVQLDIYYHSNFMMRYSTHMRFTFVELLASFGGIIGLFLGASLLSAVELGYYLSFGLYAHLRKHYQFGCNSRRNKAKVRAADYAKWDGNSKKNHHEIKKF